MTQHTVNAWGIDPATVTQAHADRVAAALGLAGAERIGCGGFLHGCRTGWLTLTAKPFHPEHPDIVTVPWSLVAGLGEDAAKSILLRLLTHGVWYGSAIELDMDLYGDDLWPQALRACGLPDDWRPE